MTPVKGTCMQMCPKEETVSRKSQKLVHRLECDPNEMVKCFSRSAAGRTLNKPHLLRPPSVLKNTISYLLNNVLAANVSFNCVYDFIDDRFNAIRQDATIQEVSNEDWIDILSPIIRFHAYAAYKCFEYDINTFDPVLNIKHFHECILKIVKIFLKDESTNDLCAEMVSLLIVANLGDYSVLQQTLPFLVKKNLLIKKATLLSVNIMNGDLGQLLKTINEFPKIHQCVICVQLPTLRRCILESLCLGFNCKKNYFPVSILTKILLHNKDQDTAKECEHYGIKMIDGKAELSKASFNNKAELLHLKKTVDFNASIPDMILNS